MSIWLTGMVGILQLVLGGMGVWVSLRPPKKETHWYWMAGFTVIGLLGVGLTAWLAKAGDEAQREATQEIHKAEVSATQANTAATSANTAATSAATAATNAEAETRVSRREAQNAQRLLTKLAVKTANVAADAVEATTGGKSYPEVILIFNSANPNFLGLAAEIEKTKNVGEFVYEVSRLDDKCYSIPDSHVVKVIAHNSTGPIQPGLRRFLSDVSLDPALEGESHYKIIMEAKNGRFMQCLDVRRNTTTGHWDSQTFINLGNFAVMVQGNWQ